MIPENARLFDGLFGPFRRTKMICTLGPQSVESSIILEMIRAGMDIARLNFSHGTQTEHRIQASRVRACANRLGKSVALLQDLQGPKIRIGEMKPDVAIQKDAKFTLTTNDCMGDESRAFTSYQDLPLEVMPGDLLLLDDGLLVLEVQSIVGVEVNTKVMVGGILSSHKGIHLPSSKGKGPILSDKDLSDLAFGKEIGADLVALSFVRSAEDVLVAKSYIQKLGDWNPLLIAKIEKKEAVAQLKDILEVADGIMVARGDLGVELGLKRVPLIQKEAIEQANRQGKWVITATQMLESMIEHRSPTRAEVSDVANAVLDGTDAVMLSAETASGRYPIVAVQTMDEILREIEATPRFFTQVKSHASFDRLGHRHALAKAAVAASASLEQPVILVWDEDGDLVRLLSEARPDALIVALHNDEEICRKNAINWGVISVKAHVPFETFSSLQQVRCAVFAENNQEMLQKNIICLRHSLKNKQCLLELFFM